MPKQNYYCFTMRKCSGVSTYKQAVRVIDEYERYIINMKTTDEQLYVNYHYEVTPMKKGKFNLHLHAMLRTPNDEPYQYPKRGFKILIEGVRSRIAWDIYITKQRLSKRDILSHFKDAENNHWSEEEGFNPEDHSPTEDFISTEYIRENVFRKK